MNVVRDLLDKKVVDRNGVEMGRVDRIVVAIGGGSPPVVTAIEIGSVALGARVSDTIARWIAAFQVATGLGEIRPLRIGATDILAVEDRIRVDRAVADTTALMVEHQLREWVDSIPGAL
jgi:sporulation protein YlmC with PRC-barrel domain